MATGIIFTTAASQTLNYTPQTDTKLLIHALVGSGGGGSVAVAGNLIALYTGNTSSSTYTVTDVIIYVGGGQTISITNAPSSTACYLIVSALES